MREDLGYFEGITQIDGGAGGLSASWPQIEFLADMLLDYPNATFVLTRRNESNWASSAQAFAGGAVAKGITTMSKVSAHVTSLHNTEDLAVFAAEHTERVRRIVLRHRVPHFIEVDIEHPAAGEVLAASLPTPKSSRALKKGSIAACWITKRWGVGPERCEQSEHVRRQHSTKDVTKKTTDHN